MGPGTITFYDNGSTRRLQVAPSQASFAEMFAPCRFAATAKATGASGLAVGTCQLTSIYENFQWRLCDSRFLPASSLTPFMIWR